MHLARGVVNLTILAVYLSITFWVFIPGISIAASITSARDVLSRSKISTLADHEIKFVTPTGVQADADTITVAFESNYALGTFSVNNIDLSVGDSNNCTTATFTDKTLAATNAAGVWGVSQASQTITFDAPTDATTGEITADRCVKIEIGSNATSGASGASIITNPTTAGDYTVTIGGTFGDTGTISTNIVNEDQVTVTASVDSSLACTVDNTSTAFGTFVVNTIDTASSTITWTVSTNATSGYALTVRDQGNGTNPGLYSAAAGYLIGSADNSFNNAGDLGALSIGYGLQGTKTDGDAGSAATTVAATYNVTGNNVGGFERTATTLASATGPVANATVTSTLKAKISGLVPAGSDYTDTLTYVCTAIF
ncbi:hypothetical protein HY844_00420 [Candidatus Berkelbacteria bacterium]|nr:hypothetical protein [Candidatus Berkelbacteria bacterium]